MSSKPFRFKQFTIEQDRCAMKIGSDAVLMGALLDLDDSKKVLEIGTGTGVIILMLAQRFTNCHFQGVEIQAEAAEQCRSNFENSPFANRLEVFHDDFISWAPNGPYDHIFSNPPYYLNAHSSGKEERDAARHSSLALLEAWLLKAQGLLHEKGRISLILPPSVLSQIVIPEGLYKEQIVNITSFPNQEPVRVLITFSNKITTSERVIFLPIYQQQKEYSEAYRILLKDFLIIF